jgi:hypothetical protein
MPTLNQLACTPALNEAKAMFSLTIKLRLNYKQAMQILMFLFTLLR